MTGAWVIVPREPDHNMQLAANNAALSFAVLSDDMRFAVERATYTAMLCARPAVPEEVAEKMARAMCAASGPCGMSCCPEDGKTCRGNIGEHELIVARAALKALEEG